MKKQATLTIVMLIALAIYFGYYAVCFIALNPGGYESIICPILSIGCIIASIEQVKNLKTKKS